MIAVKSGSFAPSRFFRNSHKTTRCSVLPAAWPSSAVPLFSCLCSSLFIIDICSSFQCVLLYCPALYVTSSVVLDQLCVYSSSVSVSSSSSSIMHSRVQQLQLLPQAQGTTEDEKATAATAAALYATTAESFNNMTLAPYQPAALNSSMMNQPLLTVFPPLYPYAAASMTNTTTMTNTVTTTALPPAPPPFPAVSGAYLGFDPSAVYSALPPLSSLYQQQHQHQAAAAAAALSLGYSVPFSYHPPPFMKPAAYGYQQPVYSTQPPDQQVDIHKMEKQLIKAVSSSLEEQYSYSPMQSALNNLLCSLLVLFVLLCSSVEAISISVISISFIITTQGRTGARPAMSGNSSNTSAAHQPYRSKILLIFSRTCLFFSCLSVGS